MDINSRLSISYYEPIAEINKEHKVYVVRNIRTGKIYVKKMLAVYNRTIYEYLQCHPIPHTPKIYEIYEENSELIIIEEYISGETLEEKLLGNVKFSIEDIRNILIRLCTILSELHHCTPPIIHRDIKPSNIILAPSGEVFLLDFNAAKYHSDTKPEDTTLLGTKGYAAPEQYGFGVSTPQTDIYALGMLLNTLVTGSFSQEICKNHKFSPIITKCTRLEPSRRYQSVDDILRLFRDTQYENAKSRFGPPNWAGYLPPGFRKFSPINMLFASVGYLFVFWMCLTLNVENATPEILFFNRLFCLLMFLSAIFFTFDYRNVQSHFPLCRNKNILLRTLGIVFMDALIIASFMVLVVLVEFIFTK